ncbi:hypothetical protein [Enterococcus faecalis]|nr:hypothetical protein HS5302_2189 [Enterococcus faecalis]
MKQSKNKQVVIGEPTKKKHLSSRYRTGNASFYSPKQSTIDS